MRYWRVARPTVHIAVIADSTSPHPSSLLMRGYQRSSSPAAASPPSTTMSTIVVRSKIRILRILRIKKKIAHFYDFYGTNLEFYSFKFRHIKVVQHFFTNCKLNLQKSLDKILQKKHVA